MEDFLNQLLTTLNQIEVKGKNNMDYLLGAIMAVQSALDGLNEKEEETDGR